MNKVFLFLIAFLMFNKAIASELNPIELTDSLVNEAPYHLQFNDMGHYLLPSDERVNAYTALEKGMHIGKRCRPKKNQKCVFKLELNNSSTIQPMMRVRYFGHNSAQFHFINKALFEQEQERVAERQHFYFIRVQEHFNNIVIEGLVQSSQVVLIEFSKGESVTLNGDFFSKRRFERDYNLGMSVNAFLLFVFFTIVVSYVVLRKEAAIFQVLLSFLYYISLFIFLSMFHFSFVDEMMHSDQGRIKQFISAIVAITLLFELFFSSEEAAKNTVKRVRMVIYLIFILALNSLYLFAEEAVSILVITTLSYLALSSYITFYLDKTKRKVVRYIVTASILYILCIQLYFFYGIHLKIFESSWAKVVLLLPLLPPVLMMFIDLKDSKVITLGQYNRLLKGSTLDYLTGVKNYNCLIEDLGSMKNESFYYCTLGGSSLEKSSYGQNLAEKVLVEFTNKLEINKKNHYRELYRVKFNEFVLVCEPSQCPISLITSVFQELSSEFVGTSLNIGHSIISNNVDALSVFHMAEYSALKARKTNVQFLEWDVTDSISLYCLEGYKDKALELMNPRSVVCYFQKIVPCHDGVLDKVELLCRFRDEEGKVHPAFKLLDIVEAHDLHEELDLVMVAYAKEAFQRFSPKVKVSINVSPLSLYSKRYQQAIQELPAENKERLVIEVTEHSFYDNDMTFKDVVSTYQQQKVSISMDDFGSGYSSYQQLASSYFNELKIDGTLIQGIKVGCFRYFLVKSIIELCKHIDCKVTAEYVDTEEVADILKSLGVDYLQGFYFHKPSPLSDVSRFNKH